MSTADASAESPRRGLDSIPVELRDRPQWVVWKAKRRGAKTTKVPYRTGNPFATAESDDPSTWGTFDEARAQLLNRGRTGIAGIGYVFSPDDPYTGIDLDDCLKEGKLLPWAEPILMGFMPTYAEVSPSGNGVKIWVRTKLPGKGTRKAKFADDGSGAVEMYDCGRYFTTTGEFIKPYFVIEDRSEAVVSLYERIKSKSKQHGLSGRNGGLTPSNLSDGELVAKAIRAKNGPKFSALWNGNIAGYGSESEADFALAALIAFWAGPDEARIERIFSESALGQRGKWKERPDYRELTIDNVLAGKTEFYEPKKPAFKIPSTGDPNKGGNALDAPVSIEKKPEVVISTLEHMTNDEACGALALDLDVYCRSGLLSEIILEEETPHKSIIKPPGGLRIATMTRPRIRDILTRDASFIKLEWNSEAEEYDKIPAHPPDWCVSAVEARQRYPGVRPILGTIETPIIRPDGSILTEPGYDPSTYLYYKPNDEFPPVAERPTLDDAKSAAALLLTLVVDFPFVNAAHKVAWLSGVLTPFARFAIFGACPLHYFDASCRGTGKSMLTDLISVIMTGRDMARTIYTDDNDEMRKRITAVALAAEMMMLFDNIDIPFGGASLDAMLTGMSWRDRILGVSQITREIPLFTCWYGSGNNTIFKGDITRRIIYSRLETTEEKPEERRDFTIEGDLLEYARRNRGKLVVAALTILRAHAVAQRPQHDLTPMGSYGAWSRVVREAICWTTGIDPYEGAAMMKEGDPEAIARGALLSAWRELPGASDGLTTAEALKLVKDNPSTYSNLRSIFLEWSRSGDLPTSRSVGMRLNAIRGRIVENKRFRSKDASKGTLAWYVEEVPSGGTNGTKGTDLPLSREISEVGSPNAVMDKELENPNFYQVAATSPASPSSPTNGRVRGRI